MVVTLAIAGVALLAILVRPFRIAEFWWAVLGALALVLAGRLPFGAAWAAVLRGADVYLFLLGMLLLAEVLRTQGVFERLAAFALRAAGASQLRLFGLVFLVGTGVTVFFSNDATAVVLTRAVATALGRTRVSPYPYLFACAFVANAASFVLPISNPANLVVFGGALPRLGAWVSAFWLASIVAVVLTFAVLLVGHWRRLSGSLVLASSGDAPDRLGAASRAERVATVACGSAALGMVAASLVGLPLGACAFGLALAAFAAVCLVERGAFVAVPRGIDYGIVPLVAGLFVIVAALDRAGGAAALRAGFAHALALGVPSGGIAAGAALALACNAINNLPVGLGVASAFSGDGASLTALRHAALVAIDLGPNLAVSGSLATLLWMDALRRADVAMDAPRFLRSGVAVALPALLAALAIVR